jgi:hypothetical protein
MKSMLVGAEGGEDMKVKWKQQVARLVPAATLVALVATIGAGVMWG